MIKNNMSGLKRQLPPVKLLAEILNFFVQKMLTLTGNITL